MGYRGGSAAGYSGRVSEPALAMTRLRLTLCAALCLAAACAGEDGPLDAGTQPLDAGEVHDAGLAPTDAGTPDAGTPDSGVRPTPACPERVVWSYGPELPEPRDHHATFLWSGAPGPNLYVVDGFDDSGVLTNAWRAPIAEDGSLGAWQPAGGPNARVSGMALAQHGARIYMVGGHNGSTRVAFASSFTVDAAGQLADTREEAALPQPRFHASAASNGDLIFVTGGLGSSGSAEPSVFRSRVQADGTLEAWTRLDDLPAPRSHHSSYVKGDALYLVSGFSGNPVGNRITPHPDVLRATIGPDGDLGAWETVIDGFPADGLSTHANAVFEACTLTFGGIDADPQVVSDAVLKVDVAGGVATRLAADSDLLVPRSHVHHSPVYNGFVYLVSGRDTFSSNTATVLVGRLE